VTRSLAPALACLAVVLSACSGSTPLAPPIGEPLRVVALTPAPTAALSRGATTVGLRLVSQLPGRLALSVRDQSGTALLDPEPSVELRPGREAGVEATITVPSAASSIEVLARVRPADGGDHSVVLQARYVVR
jgi:hypothetical protein